MAPKKRKRSETSKTDSVEAKKIILHWKCEYCERAFQRKHELTNHVDNVHRCKICYEIVPDNEKVDHAEKEEIKRKQQEEIERNKKQFYDDFVENFIRTKKLNDYQSDENLDFDYIFENYQSDIDNEQLLYFVKHGMDIYDYFECLENSQIIFLLENDGISEDIARGYIDNDVCENEEIIEYFLEKNLAIEPRWVAKLLSNHSLIERIKQKQHFDFEDIYSECCDMQFGNFYEKKSLYEEVHAHFPDPDYVEPKKFECVTNIHVNDYLFSRYYYDEESDELSICVGHDKREIALGRCKDLIKNENNLYELIAKYHDAIKAYIEANNEVQEMFDKINDLSDSEDSEDDRPRYDFFGDRNPRKNDYLRGDLYKEVYSDQIPQRNYCANVASHTYFVIAQKPEIVHTLEYLAMRTIAKGKIDFNNLAPSLKEKIVQSFFQATVS